MQEVPEKLEELIQDCSTYIGRALKKANLDMYFVLGVSNDKGHVLASNLGDSESTVVFLMHLAKETIQQVGLKDAEVEGVFSIDIKDY